MFQTSSISAGFPFRLGDQPANGFSVASRCTWLALPGLSVILDLGWFVEPMARIPHAFISHLHLDHCLGLPTWVSWRHSRDPGRPVRVHVPGEVAAQAEDMIRSALAAEQRPAMPELEVVGLADGDRVGIGNGRSVVAFATSHAVPTLGYEVREPVKRLLPEFRGRPGAEIAEARRQGITVHAVEDRCLLAYVPDTTLEVFDRRPELLAATTLVVECSDFDGVLEHGWPLAPVDRPERSHVELGRLGPALGDFKGRNLVIAHVPAKFSRCDVAAYLLPRLPPEVRPRLAVMPHGGPDRALTASPSPRPEWQDLPEPSPVPEGWVVRERPGAFARAKKRRHRELAERWGDYRIAYRWGDGLISRDAALALYEESYLGYLQRTPELVDWLVATAADVFDYEPGNVASALDYHAQDDGPTHLQDIAVRRCLLRLGRWFEGDHLVQIRGLESEAFTLNPGVIPFHRLEMLFQPELPGWWLPGSVESFWQSNKVVITPP